MVASLATVGKSGGAIAIYEHISVSDRFRTPLAANTPYATCGASVTLPLATGAKHPMHLGPALTQKHIHSHHR
jgi:hypothetical protein